MKNTMVKNKKIKRTEEAEEATRHMEESLHVATITVDYVST